MQPSIIQPLVMKFGGTSVGNADAIRRTAAIVAQYAPTVGAPTVGAQGGTPETGRADMATLRSAPQVVVVSAMCGVTEALLDCTALAAAGRTPELQAGISHIAARHLWVIRDLFPAGAVRAGLENAVAAVVDELAGICAAITRQARVVPHLSDAAASLGERLNARIVAAALEAAGLPALAIDATELIATDARFTSAAPLAGPTRRRARAALAPLLAQGCIPVVTGFIGAAPDGRVTTLGRGGSDYTASILGAGLDAAEVRIWTDVAGVMTADPRLVPEAALVDRIGYADVHELANFGGRVLHPRTIEPIRRRGIPVRVLNTFDPLSPGTLICRGGAGRRAGLVVTLLAGARLEDEALSIVSLVGRAACSRELKTRAHHTLDRQHVAVYRTQQARGRNRFSVWVPEAAACEALRSLHRAVVAL